MSKKREKFVQLATNRVNRVVNDMKLIGNLSNRSAYEYTDEDIKKITRTLQRELDQMKTRLEGTGRAGNSEFTL